MPSSPRASASPSPSSRPHHPGLDGLRGLAVVGVLLYHGGFSWAHGGFLGVSTFFTLSGFLITGLLVAEHQRTGRISLGAFWSKRFRRLMPASLVALAGVAAFARFAADADQLREVRWDALSGLGYVANWRFILAGRSYGDAFGAPSPVQHFWSLAIEEQFYVLFPLLAAACLHFGKGRLRLLAGVCGGLAIASAVITWRAGGAADISRAYFGTDTRAAELLIGALLALWLARRPVQAWGRRSSLAAALVGVAALGATVYLWSTSVTTDRWLYRGGLVAVAALSSILVVASVTAGPVRRVLSIRPLRAAGTISYGLYLYHWPVFLWLTPKRTGLTVAPLFALRMGVTIAIALASYHLVEQVVRHRRPITTWRPTLVGPGLALAVAALLVGVTNDPPPPTFDFASSSSISASSPAPAPAPAPPAPPAVADAADDVEVAPAAPLRVMVVGDSIASVLGRALVRWGERTGKATVWDVSIPGCGMARGGLIYSEDGSSRPTVKGCDAWATRWTSQMAEFRPDVVLVHTGPWEMTTRKMPGWTEPVRFGEPAHDAFVVSELVAAVDVLRASGATVAWANTPCMHSYAGHTHTIFDPANVEHFDGDLLRRVRSQRADDVVLLDLFRQVCPGGKFTGTVGGVADARPDGVHFVPQAADALAEWLGAELVSGLEPAGAAVAGRPGPQ